MGGAHTGGAVMNAEQLLDAARTCGLAVAIVDGSLEVRGKGAPPADLVDDLVQRASEVAEFLVCGSCGCGDQRLVPAYWGPRLCPACCQLVAQRFDQDGSWPPVPWEV